MTGPNLNLACWNVRGLNSEARRAAVHEILATTTIHIACLQETKMSNIDQNLAEYL
jgi:exonuclease III